MDTLNKIGGHGGHCCEAVVDPTSLLTVIGAIAALALFLRHGSMRTSLYLKTRFARLEFL